MDKQMKIAIIGGGPSGLTLARILQVKGFKKVTVYERDESRLVRGQGGTLDLHDYTGQHALKAAQLMEDFKRHCRYEGQDTRIEDKDGVRHYEEFATDDNNDRPEIDRSDLRDILLNSLHEDTVKWGHVLSSLHQLPDGKVELNFQNGVTARAEFVVGADGAWSKVRPYLSLEKPFYSGICSLEFNLSDVDTSHPEVANYVGRGQVYVFSEGQGLISQRNSNGVIRVYTAFRAPEDFLKSQGFDFADIEKTKDFLLDKFNGWNEKMLTLIRANSGEFIPRVIHALKVGHSWSRDANDKENSLASKITILGDAAHLMSPFAGQGANLAMFDAACLATVFDSSKDYLQAALVKFEKEMFARSEIAARFSADNTQIFFGPNAAVKGAEAVKGMLKSLPNVLTGSS